MSRFQCTFQSKVLHNPVNITVSLPFPIFDPTAVKETLDDIYAPRHKFKTLYLLHGAFSDSSSWTQISRAEEYADRYGLALVMPSAGNSFYTDLLHGPAYWSFISEELPRFVRSIFPLSEKREDNFVAGFSMGGYGALKLALNKPESFSAGIIISGVLDIVSVMKNPIHPLFDVNEYYGGFDKLEGSHNDLFAQLQRLKASGATLPRLYITCGVDDFVYNMNVKFRDFANANAVPLTFEDGPGAHTSDFLDQGLLRSLKWLASNE
ncbi:MAG: esterase family protein [Anaerolineales bacterium]|nr:esterase family protein [Anaerolineales bacterium]